jgi:hypothetical protein
VLATVRFDVDTPPVWLVTVFIPIVVVDAPVPTGSEDGSPSVGEFGSSTWARNWDPSVSSVLPGEDASGWAVRAD